MAIVAVLGLEVSLCLLCAIVLLVRSTSLGAQSCDRRGQAHSADACQFKSAGCAQCSLLSGREQA